METKKRMSYPDPVHTICAYCEVPLVLTTPKQKWVFRKVGRAVCCHAHARQLAVLTPEGRKKLGEIWKTRKTPPPEVKRKAIAVMKEKLRAMKWKPPIQGGNGRGPT